MSDGGLSHYEGIRLATHMSALGLSHREGIRLETLIRN
jgi:hypothetical protein